jgi:hypothetical protein
MWRVNLDKSLSCLLWKTAGATNAFAVIRFDLFEELFFYPLFFHRWTMANLFRADVVEFFG